MNQELKQYLWFFVDYRQKNQPEWSAMVELVVNNKTYLVMKVSLFITNYGRELRIEVDIRRKGKVEKIIEFAERIKRVQEKVEIVLKKAQKEIKQQVNKRRNKVKE